VKVAVKKVLKMHKYTTYQASWKEACAMADEDTDFKWVFD
jgi:hypothetical protein